MSALPLTRMMTLATLLAPSPVPTYLGGLAPAPSPLRPLNSLANLYTPPRWIAVRERFARFHGNLLLTPAQQTDGHTKRAGVVNCLNRSYYGTNSDTDNSFFVGSWAKGTAIRPPRDVDVYFLLPPTVYHRFQNYAWARQSALLQEVKGHLSVTYPDTDMSGDGQVIVVNFSGYNVEVVPAFQITTPYHYWICNTNYGGSYKETAPWAEVVALDTADTTNAKNLRPLIRMLKAWQTWCSVDIKSFHLELLATEFLTSSPWRLKDWFWFDWIIRDFFAFLYQRANSTILVPGTYEVMPLGDAWQSRALSAYYRAFKACQHEYENNVGDAGDEWQKIFGTDIPRTL